MPESMLFVSLQSTLMWMCMLSLITWSHTIFLKGPLTHWTQHLESSQWIKKIKKQSSKKHYYPERKLKTFQTIVQNWYNRNWFCLDRNEVGEYSWVALRYINKNKNLTYGIYFDWNYPVFLIISLEYFSI